MNDLRHLHKEIARLELSGLSLDDIHSQLSDLGLSREYIQGVQRNPIYQAFLARLSDEANEVVKDVRVTLIKKAHDMLEVIVRIAENEEVSSATRLSAAKDLLDRAGYGAVKKVNFLDERVSFSSEERNSIRLIHEQMKKSGFILGSTLELPPSMIDVTPSTKEASPELEHSTESGG